MWQKKESSNKICVVELMTKGGYLPGNIAIHIVDVVDKKEVGEFKDPGNSHNNQKLQRQNLTSKFYKIVLRTSSK